MSGPATAVEEAAEKRVEPLSPAATGVRLTRPRTPAPVLSPTPAGSIDTAKLVIAPPGKRPIGWVSFMLVFAAAAALTFAAVYVNALRSGSGIATPQFLRAILPPVGLGLRVEAQGDRLLVNWDRRSPIVRSAQNGILRIDDGGQRRALYLDPAQVAAGSILYKPASGDVTFRLEVQSEQGATVLESVRVLDALKPASAHDDVFKPETNGSVPAPLPSIQSRPASPGPETPAQRKQPDTQPAEKPAPGAAPRHDLSDTSPLNTTPAAAIHAASSFLTLPAITEAAVPQANEQPRAAPPTEAPDGKSISMAQPARALRQVMPDMKALGVGLVYSAVRVEVRVTIDKSGHVKSARVVKDGQKVNQGLARAALTAARQWRFEPARVRGTSIESEHSILFEFRPTAP